MDGGRQRLEIFVLPDCVGCRTATDLARRIQAALPEVDVQLIDLSAQDAMRPAAVFAVPTYMLDGRVLSLGNPDPSWLLARLARPGPSDWRSRTCAVLVEAHIRVSGSPA